MKKKIICLLIAVIMLFGVSACKNDGDSSQSVKDVITSAEIPEGYTEYSINEWNGRYTEGFGCQIDTHIYNNGFSDDELEMLYSRVIEMNLQNIRTQVFPEWYERGNDNDDPNVFDADSANVDFNSIEMVQLFKLLDFCEKNGIKVDLSFYGCQPNFTSKDGKITKSWLASPFTKNWITSPKLVDENGAAFPGLEEFAESVYGLLNYVLNVKKYTCVNEFSVFPEPDLAYVTANASVSHTEYVQLVKIVDEKLKKEGIRNKIQFSGPAAASSSVMNFMRYAESLGDVFDKLTISSYRYDDKDDNSTFTDYGSGMVELCDEKNVSFGVTEFGSKNVIDSCNQTDIDTYDRALFLGRYMIGLMNTGCTSMKYWEIADMNYGGSMMRLGLWKYRNEDYKARPQYYTWSLITKYTELGSQVYPIVSKDGDFCAVAFRLPSGDWTYYACNTSSETKKISFVNYSECYPRSMNVYEVRASKCTGEVTPVKSEIKAEINSGAINVKVAPNSFVAISTK